MMIDSTNVGELGRLQHKEYLAQADAARTMRATGDNAARVEPTVTVATLLASLRTLFGQLLGERSRNAGHHA